MSIRTTLILAVIVALLGALYYFGDKVKAPDEDTQHPKLVSVKADDVTSIDVTTGGTTLTLEKKNGLWFVTAPYKGFAATHNVQNVVNQLADMQADRIVNEDSTAGILKQYGLDKPQFTVRLHLKDSKTTPTVAFGIRAPSETGWYARSNDTGPVLLAGNGIAADILRGPQGWREGAPLFVDNAKIHRVEASGGGIDLALAKEKDKPEWSMTKPRAAKADAMAINQWLLRLQGDEVKKFFDDVKPGDRRLEPTFTLKLWNKDEQDPMVVTVGEKTEGGWYALRSAAGTQEVFLLPDSKLTSLKIDPSEVADKHLFSELDINKADRAKVVETTAGTAEAQKSDGIWSFSKPTTRKDDLGKVTALLYLLKDLKYEHRVTDPKELEAARASLATPLAVFEIADDKGVGLATLTVGGETPQHRRYVRTRGDDVYTADASFATDWKANIQAIQNSGPAASPAGGVPPVAPSPITTAAPR